MRLNTYTHTHTRIYISILAGIHVAGHLRSPTPNRPICTLPHCVCVFFFVVDISVLLYIQMMYPLEKSGKFIFVELRIVVFARTFRSNSSNQRLFTNFGICFLPSLPSPINPSSSKYQICCSVFWFNLMMRYHRNQP